MKQIVLAAGLLTACGSNHNAIDYMDAPFMNLVDAAPNCVNTAGPPPASCSPVTGTTVSVRKIGSISGSAILATSPPNDGRIFVITQDGQIMIFEDEQLRPTPFLDISTTILAEAPPGERGLLGLAFHPDYACNGQFFVWYTTSTADVLERFSVSQNDINVADPASGTVILSVPDPYENHNAGMIQFGSDGFLYISTGDGGSAGDPRRNAQATDRTDPTCVSNQCEPLLGKILRIDVDHPANGKPYGIPSTNASRGRRRRAGDPDQGACAIRGGGRLDAMTGDIWIGDVGQDMIRRARRDSRRERSPAHPGAAQCCMGWSQYEANSCYDANYPCANPTCASSTCDSVRCRSSSTHTSNWVAIGIGGEIYRGACCRASSVTTSPTLRRRRDGASIVQPARRHERLRLGFRGRALGHVPRRAVEPPRRRAR